MNKILVITLAIVRPYSQCERRSERYAVELFGHGGAGIWSVSPMRGPTPERGVPLHTVWGAAQARMAFGSDLLLHLRRQLVSQTSMRYG